MRLIDADEVYKVLTDYYHQRTEIQHEALKEAIGRVPTIDAVEVLRCKDCKHNYHNMIPSGEAEHGCTKYIELPITADFYCAWGEREEDGSTDN